jgi:LuxR family maltose regulon positive regulatory protein
LIKVYILRAVVEEMQKKSQTAKDYIERAIALGEPEGFVRIYVTPGPDRSDRFPSGLSEPLSEREQQVLRLLQTHLSQREIADELCVSVNTIRFHAKNIYRKLGVHERSEAVGKAKAAGLL